MAQGSGRSFPFDHEMRLTRLRRLINENLYKTDSHQARELMRNDSKVFEEVRYVLMSMRIALVNLFKPVSCRIPTPSCVMAYQPR